MFWNYTKLVFKSVILQLNLFIGLVGVLTVYYSEAIPIPYWVFLILPFVALYYVGYSIYKNSSPSITIIPPDEDDIEVTHNSNMSFNIVMKSRITNFGTRAGSLESIELHHMGFNGIKDEFIISKLPFSVIQPTILKEKPLAMLGFSQGDSYFNYPLMVSVDENDYLYFYTEFYIGHHYDKNVENKKDELKWLKTLDFELEYKYKDTRETYVKKAKVVINTDNFYDIYKKAKKEQEEFEERFKGL